MIYLFSLFFIWLLIPYLISSRSSDRFHDAGTYDARTKTGGPNGSIRNLEELNHVANTGLAIAVDFCGNYTHRLLSAWLRPYIIYIDIIYARRDNKEDVSKDHLCRSLPGSTIMTLCITEMTLINLINYKQLAGVVAVEISGGPSIDFVPGRKVGGRFWTGLNWNLEYFNSLLIKYCTTYIGYN